MGSDEQYPQHQSARLRFLAWPDVTALTSLSRETIRKLVIAGDFPRPRVITSARTVFVAHEVEQWMAHKAAAPAARVVTNVQRARARRTEQTT